MYKWPPAKQQPSFTDLNKQSLPIKKQHSFTDPNKQAPLIRSLFPGSRSMIENHVRKSLSGTGTPQEQQEAYTARLERIMHWQKILDEKFANWPADRTFCLQSLGRLMAAKFSGHAQSFGALEWTLERLINCIADHKPITFTFCFGGYKNHRSPAYPQVDWAEIFHLNFIISYLWPIIDEYKHGVILEYESEEISIQYNNVPQEQTDQYTASFQKLLALYHKKFKALHPNVNLTFKFSLARDFYTNDDALYALIEKKRPDYEKIFTGLSAAEKAKWLQRAESNFMWEQGTIPYQRATLSNAEQQAILRNARISNEAFLEADYILRQSYFEDPYRIPIVGTWGCMPSAQPVDGWIHIKSTRLSLVDFWIGTGCLVYTQDANGKVLSIGETILSDSQRIKLAPVLQNEKHTELRLTDISSNFSTILRYVK